MLAALVEAEEVAEVEVEATAEEVMEVAVAEVAVSETEEVYQQCICLREWNINSIFQIIHPVAEEEEVALAEGKSIRLLVFKVCMFGYPSQQLIWGTRISFHKKEITFLLIQI